MANWRFTIAYDGTAYAGWQIQPADQTVQGRLHDCLSRLFQAEVTVAGCSRTDSGVHALCQVATFHPPPKSPIPATDAHRALRQMLPPDIRLLATEVMPDGFHARHDAVGKCYTYVLHRGELQSPFVPRYCWIRPAAFDIHAMGAAAKQLVGRYDFTTFSATSDDPGCTPVKTLTRLDMREHGRFLLVTVVGDSFLYKMVRRLVGFLVAVGRGQLDAGHTARIRDAGERNAGFDTAPPQGLFLEQVFYDEAELQAFTPGDLPFLQLMGEGPAPK
ncbi:MAG: tRNA pseudouridine(38-40) synthase TruA [Lentisphaeria bacterium]|jgi:tRNA pseudouridine38-40 synthase|nr:tRNA pseudouridine(38-40) synthase TruA [Lentisphaeria bacterium]MDP7739870.1 tRNA pseudouridine(38-40) synthase TruA [Lentisphaeria bacterium]